jgi:hypothetical protein
MSGSNQCRIPQLCCDDMQWEHASKLGFSRTSQVLEQAIPGRQPGADYYALELGAQIDAAVTGPINHESDAGGLELFEIFQMGAQFRKQRYEPLPLATAMLEFARMDKYSIAFPINVFPFQREEFRWAAQSSETTKSYDHPPLRRRAWTRRRAPRCNVA